MAYVYGQAQEYTNIGASPEAKFLDPDWGIKSTLALGKVQSGMGLIYSTCVGVDSGVDVR